MLPGESVLPQVVQTWSRKLFLPIHCPCSNTCLKSCSSALFPAASCQCWPWDGNLPYLHNPPTKHNTKNTFSRVHTCVITPPFLPSSLPLPLSDVSYIESSWPETVRPSRQRLCLFVCLQNAAPFPWTSLFFHNSNHTEFYCFCDMKSYFKNVFIPLWVLKRQ